mmetsp:Transcript_35362/g.82780  ORF Transcript_35362/g.82780 Transcript_35362/m.82780 type:complete len:360 (-) Transcript_35362:63-1142(-)
MAAVKVQAQLELRGLATVPRPNDDSATLPRAVDRRLQSPHVPAHFYGHVEVTVGRVPPHFQSTGMQHSPSSHPPCDRSALLVELDGHNAVAPHRPAQDGSDKQTDETLPVDCHPLSNDGSGFLDQRQSCLDSGEVARILRRDAGGHHNSRVSGDDCVASVGRKSKHQAPHPLPSIDTVSNRLHAANQAVAILQRICHGRILHILNRRVKLRPLIEISAKHLELRPAADYASDTLEQQLALPDGGHIRHIYPDLFLCKKLQNLPPSTLGSSRASCRAVSPLCGSICHLHFPTGSPPQKICVANLDLGTISAAAFNPPCHVPLWLGPCNCPSPEKEEHSVPQSPLLTQLPRHQGAPAANGR